MEAQLIETAILNIVNHQCLIATKAARVCYAAKGDNVMEFGLRARTRSGFRYLRCQSCRNRRLQRHFQCSRRSDVPCAGTRHARPQLDRQSFPDEYTAFRKYAELYPSACILLVDTYDTLKSGIPNAIRVFTEMRDAGIPLTYYGIRMDSGDLALPLQAGAQNVR